MNKLKQTPFILIILLLAISSAALAGKPNKRRSSKRNFQEKKSLKYDSRYYRNLVLGANEVNSHKSLDLPVLVYIVGVKESGGTSGETLRELERLGVMDSHQVYLYRWDNREDIEYLRASISSFLNVIQIKHKKSKSIGVFGHSAGGILLLNALCESGSGCNFKLTHKNIHFSTAGSPLGGYNFGSPRWIKAIIGDVLYYASGRISYKEIDPDIIVNLYLTSFDNDLVLKDLDEYDMRYPLNINYMAIKLPNSTHGEAILDAIKDFYGL